CIVSAGSEAGLQGLADNTPYGGTKGFMHAFTMGVAAEQARYGVRANCVCPGPIDTAWTHKETSEIGLVLEKLMIYSTAIGRRGTPEEVANVYLFLASDEASYVTGALYPVDGGILIAKGPMGLKADSEKQKKPEGELELKHAKEGATSIK
ncbi:MAG: SDR family oxidoreductase, partial [Bacteroidota bacterium]|nr:SDR family oxidoreductase [Bacteroidota bacterium]